ncbi:MAG: DUF4919 domain-containing protein [Candidatus Wallbacteria bacterium]|nr:DUF4919 domain-containing protein [Candidatus Wallbacteria bacterium]
MHHGDNMSYLELLIEAISNPSATDFHNLRMEYAGSEFYRPYSRDEDHARELDSALSSGDWSSVVKAADLLLRDNYLDIEAHSAASIAFGELGDQAKAEHHKIFYQGLIESILSSGDGTGFHTAFVVTDVREEFVVIEILGLTVLTQDLVMDIDNRQYDIYEFQDRRSGKSGRIFFNIDRPKCWLDSNAPSL